MKIQTKHLFKILRVVKKTGILEKLKDFYGIARATKGVKKDVDKLQDELGIDIMISLISGLEYAETEIYDLLADITEKTIEEIQEQDPNLTIESVSNLIRSDVFKVFLNSINNW